MDIEKQAGTSITFLGTSSVQGGNAKHNGMIVQAGAKKLLVDCGENLEDSWRRNKPNAIYLSDSSKDRAWGLILRKLDESKIEEPVYAKKFIFDELGAEKG